MNTKKPVGKAKSHRRRPSKPTPKPRSIKVRAGAPKIDPKEVQLLRVAGTSNKGDGPGGEKWRIEVGNVRVGEVFINVIDEPPIGRHASIQIYLNAKSQGRGIGRVAYRKACEASTHATIYAHMRKSNTASRRAAEEAGFVDATPPTANQLIMVRRSSTHSEPSP